MSSYNGTLNENTVFNWFSRYDEVENSGEASKHFPVQTNIHPVASSLKDQSTDVCSDTLTLNTASLMLR